MELSDRKKKILRAIVDLYIRTAEPVASKTIAQMPDMDFSSATIRNEMAELTTLGYLEQPHTGRLAGNILVSNPRRARPSGDFCVLKELVRPFIHKI